MIVQDKNRTFVKLKNPYTFGVPVSSEGKFFGREEELQRIFDTLENVPRGQKQDLVVLGPRRIGKSSLLRRLAKLLVESGRDFVPVYVDVQNVLPRETQTLFFKILREIKKGYQAKGTDALPELETLQLSNIPPAVEFLTFNEDVERLNQAIATGDLPRLVLMFDEVELLLDFGGVEILEWLRSLIQATTYAVFIVAGSERLYSLTQDYGSPFYNIFKTIELFPLAPEAARELIEEPAARVGLEIFSAEVDKILSYSGNNPYFIQGIAHYLVEELNKQRRYRVYADDVDKVIVECIRYLSPQFGYFWNVASQPQRIILYALAQTGYPQTVRELISRLPSVKAFLPSRQDQSDAFDNLVQQQVLRVEDGNRYWFAVLLFADWILSSVDDEEIIELTNSSRRGEVRDTSPIRRFLTLVFSDVELQDFVLDTFRPVWEELSSSMNKGQIIERLVDYTVRHNQIAKLITEAKARYPQQYTVFDKVIGMPVTDVAVEPVSPQIDLLRLRDLLSRHFNERELRDLMFDLAVDYDSLPGWSKSEKATELVSYMERHQRLDELVNMLQWKRPHVSWTEDVSKPLERVDVARLRQQLADYFDDSELRYLMFELQIDYESLPGEGKKNKARELIVYLERRGRIPELIEIVEQLRPKISWVEEVSRPPERMDAARLAQQLAKCFDESELRTLVFDLQIDYEELQGEGKLNKARQLVRYMGRRGRLSELVEACRRERPYVEW